MSCWRCGSNDHVLERIADHLEVVRVAAADEAARFAHCQTTSERSICFFRMRRASRVDRYMCGCTSTQRMPSGTGICFVRGWSTPTVSTSPPKRLGAMLSTCAEPLATASPCHRELQQLQLGQRCHRAARWPPPRQPRRTGGRATETRTRAGCLSGCCISKPKRATAALPAWLMSALTGGVASQPPGAGSASRTRRWQLCARPGSAMRRAVHAVPDQRPRSARGCRSRRLTLPTEAGAKAVTEWGTSHLEDHSLAPRKAAQAQQVAEDTTGRNFRTRARDLAR